MRAWLAVGLVALGVIALPGNQGTGSDLTGAKNGPWQTDFASAQRLARSSGKPIFAVFR